MSCVKFGYFWVSMLVCCHCIGGWGQRCGRQWRRQFLRLPSATCHHSSTGPFLVQPPGSRAQRRRGAAEKSPMPLCHSQCPGAFIPLHFSFTPLLTIFSDSFSSNEMQRSLIGKWHGTQVVYWFNFEMLLPGPLKLIQSKWEIYGDRMTDFEATSFSVECRTTWLVKIIIKFNGVIWSSCLKPWSVLQFNSFDKNFIFQTNFFFVFFSYFF